MTSNDLTILVEGDADRRFADAIIKSRLKYKYSKITIIEYAQEQPKKISRIIQSARESNDAYIFIADLNSEKCIGIRKNKLEKKYKHLEKDKIIIVIREIEGWYLAGLIDEDMKKFGIKIYKTTNEIIKEEFEKNIPKKFTSKRDYLIEILKKYSMPQAAKRNSSFKYFLKKYKIT